MKTRVGLKYFVSYSVELHNILYDPLIGDGDSSAHRSLVKEVIYGPWKTVRKKNALIMLQKEWVLGFAQ